MRMLVAAMLAAFGAELVAGGVPAGAQGIPTPPEAVGIPATNAAAAQQSFGLVTGRSKTSLGWIAATGVVMTSDYAVDEVGTSATFTRPGTDRDYGCYVAVAKPQVHMSVLRCSGLSGTVLGVATQFPAPGTPVYVPALTNTAVDNIDENAFVFEGGQLVDNNVSFMEATRLRFSYGVRKGSTRGGILNATSAAGTPVLNAENKVVSVLFTFPEIGGQPLGMTPTEVSKAINEALPLPATFTSAAFLAIGRRAIIPVAVGLVLGLIWGLLSRNGTTVIKTLGLGMVGLLGAIGYSIFTVMVIGPQTLLA
jgi:hypothetical protein